MPDFSDGVTGWTTDRYDPHSFTILPFYLGRNDVLDIEITSAEGLANRVGGYQSAFYNTQGRGHAVTGGAWSMLEADLYIPQIWSDPANGDVRTDLWGVMTDGTGVSGYPIIGFTNYGGGGRYRVWEDDSGWIDSAIPVHYDGWTRFGILFTGTSYQFFVDWQPVYTDTTISGSTGFTAVLVQAYNFSDPNLGANPVDYHAYWSDAPEPGTWGLAGASLLVLFGKLRRRRQ
jgi:hypothetical protein